jgi:hypothetical protein
MFSVRTLAAGLLLLALAPTAARADGLITPFWGANFGGDAGSELSDAVDARHPCRGAYRFALSTQF